MTAKLTALDGRWTITWPHRRDAGDTLPTPSQEAGVSPAVDREGSEWDRAARLLRVATVLHAHPDGITAQAVADQIGVSKRTVYRDLRAMEIDAELPIWQDAGKWGLESGVFLPPLALTLPEATTFFLAARVLAKATDERDSELLSAYVKLAQVLPPVLAEHLHATVDAYATTPRNERFTRVLRVLTKAWAERRIVEIAYGPGVYELDKPPRVTRVRPMPSNPPRSRGRCISSAWTRAARRVGRSRWSASWRRPSPPRRSRAAARPSPGSCSRRGMSSRTSRWCASWCGSRRRSQRESPDELAPRPDGRAPAG